MTISKAPAVKSPESAPHPIPVVEAELKVTSEVSLSDSTIGAAEQEVPAELDVDDAPPTHTSNALLEDAGPYARYLDRLARTDKLLPLRDRQPESANPLTLGKLQAGYGKVFRDDSVIFRGRNGTDWEEPGCLYVKASFSF